MFHIIVHLQLKNIKDKEFVADCLKQVSAVTLKEEPSCRKLDVFESESDPLTFFLCEEWDHKKDWIDHREKRAFREIYSSQVLPLVERTPHISIRLNQLSN